MDVSLMVRLHVKFSRWYKDEPLLNVNVGFRLLSASGDGEWTDQRPSDHSQLHSV